MEHSSQIDLFVRFDNGRRVNLAQVGAGKMITQRAESMPLGEWCGLHVVIDGQDKETRIRIVEQGPGQSWAYEAFEGRS
jgi:hypothetical protein